MTPAAHIGPTCRPVTRRSSPFLCFRRWPLEQIGGFDAENAGQPVYDVDAGGVDAPLERADIRAIDLRLMGELFLRKALGLPQSSQIERQHVSYIHAREGAVLWRILPRSILYKLALTDIERSVWQSGRTP